MMFFNRVKGTKKLKDSVEYRLVGSIFEWVQKNCEDRSVFDKKDILLEFIRTVICEIQGIETYIRIRGMENMSRNCAIYIRNLYEMDNMTEEEVKRICENSLTIGYVVCETARAELYNEQARL